MSKRINTRFFTAPGGRPPGNPDCGTVVDDVVTLSERYDFFIVSQKTTQGSVSPTSFNVIHDTSAIAPDVQHRLANAMTHVYYNWPVSHSHIKILLIFCFRSSNWIFMQLFCTGRFARSGASAVRAQIGLFSRGVFKFKDSPRLPGQTPLLFVRWGTPTTPNSSTSIFLFLS